MRKPPLASVAHTHPRNVCDQYSSPLVQHPNQRLSIVLKKVLNCCAVQLTPEISSIKGKT